jgi:predicted CXXCH cytochrome family protein
VSCHQPHASPNRSFLQAPAKPLCTSCHENIGEQLSSETAHAPAAELDGCLDCHGPHMTANPNLLLENVSETCQACHDVDSEDFSGRHLGIEASWLDCGGCHDPHASNQVGMLLPEVHEPFASGDCSACHQEIPEPDGGTQ